MCARLLSSSTTAATTTRARVVRVAIAALLAALGVLVAASPASAHAELLSSDPADGSVLDVAPASVTLTFSEPLLAQTVAVAVSDAAGTVFDLAGPVVDRQTVTVDWPAAATAAGEFTVAYRVVSQDGHPIEGAIRLTVESGTAPSASASAVASAVASPSESGPSASAADGSVPSPTATTATTAAAAAAGSSTGLWLALGALAIALVVVFAAVLPAVRRRNRS